MKQFVLVDGYAQINNEQIFITEKNLKKDLKRRGGWSGIFFGFIGLSVYSNLKQGDYFTNLFQYLDFGLRISALIVIVCVLVYLLFLRKSKKKLFINDITKVEIDKKEFETSVNLKFSSRREFELSFRNLENQLEPFIEELKKRNTRLNIEYC